MFKQAQSNTHRLDLIPSIGRSSKERGQEAKEEGQASDLGQAAPGHQLRVALDQPEGVIDGLKCDENVEYQLLYDISIGDSGSVPAGRSACGSVRICGGAYPAACRRDFESR
jgi:hypothetical protein